MLKLVRQSCWVAAALAAGCLTTARAEVVTGIYETNGSFGSGGPFTTNRLVMNTTYDTETNALSFDVTAFDLDGVSWLDRGGSYRVDDLSGRGRFRGFFRQVEMPDGNLGTFEVFYRFVWNFNTDAPILDDMVALLSVAGQTSTFAGAATASFTPTVPPPTPPATTVPEPDSLALAGLALLLLSGLWTRAQTLSSPSACRA